MSFKPVFVRAFNNYDVDEAAKEAALGDFDESKTVQSQAEEADINNIVKRFGITGQIPYRPLPPDLGEFVDVFDFSSAMAVIRRAEESFMSLPAQVRSRFGNDPGKFVDFVADPANIEECRKMGLAKESANVIDAYQNAGKSPNSSGEGVGGDAAAAAGGAPAGAGAGSGGR